MVDRFFFYLAAGCSVLSAVNLALATYAWLDGRDEGPTFLATYAVALGVLAIFFQGESRRGS